MSVDLKDKAPVWTVQNESGSNAIDFDVFLNLEFVSTNSVAHEPIEQGGFAAYNKQNAPKEFAVTLACNRIYSEQQPILEALDQLAAGIEKVSLVTPAIEYKNLNIESYGYQRQDDAGAGMLVVELKMVEIREVEVKETVAPTEKEKKAKPITKAQTKNPSNASTARTGRTQPQQPQKTVARNLGDKVRSWAKGARGGK